MFIYLKQASPFRALLDAHMRYGEQELEFEFVDAQHRTVRVALPYVWWTHPKGIIFFVCAFLLIRTNVYKLGKRLTHN